MAAGPSLRTLIIVEFASMARAREWYASPEYAGSSRLSPCATGCYGQTPEHADRNEGKQP